MALRGAMEKGIARHQTDLRRYESKSQARCYAYPGTVPGFLGLTRTYGDIRGGIRMGA